MQHIGTYAVERELGHGATGTVYLTRTRAGRAVAVKVLHHGAGTGAAALDAARRVGGFHTAPVLDAGTDGDAVWFATAFVPAPTLAELLETRGPLDEAALRRLGTGLADALQSVHGCGLVHGGLKPSDVLMADDGPRVRDFGLRTTADGGQQSSPAADVHALGTLLTAAGGGDVTQLPESLRGVVVSCLDADENGRPDTDALIEAFHAPPRAAAASGGPSEAALEATPAPSAAPPAPYGTPPAPPAPTAPPAPPASPPAGQVPGPHVPPQQAPAPAPAPPPQGAFGPAPATAPPAHPAPGAPVPGVAHAPGGPPAEELEFLAMDRKNDMVADAHGVSFTVHGHHTDLAWPHIHYVQHRRDAQGSTFYFTVSLVLVNGAQPVCRVSTRNAWEVDQWAARLDAVLARFMPRPPQ